MQERIVEIIVFLVNELKSNKQLSEVDVTSLSRDGYTQSEISSAFSWIFDRLTLGQSVMGVPRLDSGSHRILNDAEKMIIAPEAFGYLIQCQQLGLLSGGDVETIVERIMAAGFSSVGGPEMKSFVAGVLFDADKPSGSGRHLNFDTNESIH